MGFFYFLLVVAILAVVAVALLLANNKKEENGDDTPEPLPQLGKNLGAPLFIDGDQKRLALVLCKGDVVWALTPYGPLQMTVTIVNKGEAHLKNAEFEALAFLDANYFSGSLANKLGRSCGAWRVQRVLPSHKPTIPRNDPYYESQNRHFLAEECYWDDDDGILEAMVFYCFLFDGFDQPFTYYEMYEPPVYEDVPEPPIFEEPVPEPEPEPADPNLEDTVDMPVPAEVTEETFEEGIGDGPTLGPEDEPDTEPIPEPEPPPAPEPEPYVPPTPDPEPNRSWDTGSSYDSGSDSYDSGGSDDW